MLRRITKPALSILARAPAVVPLNTTKIAFQFGTKPFNFDKLRTIVDSEIKHQEENKGDFSEYVNYFQNEGWKTNYDGVQIELSKKSGAHNLRIVFNVRGPPTQDGEAEQNQQGQEGQEAQDESDYCEVVAYINKDGTSKWMAADLMVSSKSFQLINAAFVTDYEADKKQRKSRMPSSGYPGPDIAALEEQLQQSFYAMIQSFGINWELMQRISDFSVAYEQKFYIEWLKDLKSLF